MCRDIIAGMVKSSRSLDQEPDLFSDAASSARRDTRAPVAKETAAPRHYILPKDLPSALKWLSEEELRALADAIAAEQHRRNPQKSSAPVQEFTAPTPGVRKPAVAKPVKQKPEILDQKGPSLTKARINTIRAMFKAGVKPVTIARQFGISQADVRKALSD